MSRPTTVLRTATTAALCAVLLVAGSTFAPSRAADAPPARWVAVSVATLWVRPATARPVDAPSLTNPAHPRRWVRDMTVAQKRWLNGRLETQALYGTKVYLLGRSGAWSKVAVPSQRTSRNRWGYPGWLPTVQLTSHAPARTARIAVVTSRTASLWRSPARIGTAGGSTMTVSYDTRFPVIGEGSGYVEVALLDGRHRALRSSDVSVRAVGVRPVARPSMLLTEARTMLGLDYLWAGTSGFGYDCSGFTYSLYHLLGITLRRDAAEQARHGVAVSRSQLSRGDLVFFRDATGQVVHVAIFYGWHNGSRSVIQAPRTGSAVTITPLSAWPRSRYAGARRYL